MELRKFEKHDWSGFAGAEEIVEAGVYALIGEATVNGYDALVIVDANGAEVYVDMDASPHGPDGYRFNNGKQDPALYRLLTAFFAGQPTEISGDSLTAAGFTEIQVY